jgi:hypothetical protein
MEVIMKNGLLGIITAAVVVVLAVVLAGCAKSGPVLLQDILYQAPTGTAPERAKVIVGVSPFKDVRGGSISVLGKRIISDDVQNDLVVQGTVADLVTAALKDALRSRSITVKDAPAWDLSGTPPRAEGADLIIGGEVKVLWVDCQSRPVNVKTKATVQLRVAVAETSGATILRTVNLNSTLEREDVVFSFYTVQETLSEALTSALNQLLADEVVKKRLH